MLQVYVKFPSNKILHEKNSGINQARNHLILRKVSRAYLH